MSGVLVIVEKTEDALHRKESAGFGFLERPVDV